MTIARVPEGEDQRALVSRISSDLDSALPIACRATGLALYVSDQDQGTWQCTHRFSFGRLPFSEGTAAP